VNEQVQELAKINNVSQWHFSYERSQNCTCSQLHGSAAMQLFLFQICALSISDGNGAKIAKISKDKPKMSLK